MKTLAIIVGGGPAPGINGVISAVTRYSIQEKGYNVLGIFEGFRNLIKSTPDGIKTMQLTLENTEKLMHEGGTILKTSRVNPTVNADHVRNVVKNLQALNVQYLITIGGDDTAHSSRVIAEAAKEFLHVIHVPKTIDNDLPLPYDYPTFGYSTAVQAGAKIVESLMADAKSVGRWYIVEAMGRKSGSLTLGVSTAASCQLCLIAEQFGDKEVTIKSICDCIETTIFKRDAMGYNYGVGVIAEGLAEKMSDAEQTKLFKGGNIPRDDHGHIRLEKANLAEAVSNELEKRFSDRRIAPYGLTTKKLGYELRCQEPIAFDVQYTNSLGIGAMKLLEAGMSGVMVSLSPTGILPLNLEQLRDPASGRIKVRMVDCSSRDYQIALCSMPYLTQSDLANEAILSKLCAVSKRTPEQFKAEFSHVPELYPAKGVTIERP